MTALQRVADPETQLQRSGEMPGAGPFVVQVQQIQPDAGQPAEQRHVGLLGHQVGRPDHQTRRFRPIAALVVQRDMQSLQGCF